MVEANVGVLAALGSSASWAVGSILFARLGKRLQPLALTLAKGVISVALLALVLALSRPAAPVPPQSLFLLVLSGILGIAVGDTLFFAALQRLGASVLVLLFALGQVLTVILAVLRLGERPSIVQVVGIAVVTASITAVLWLRSESDGRRTELVGILYGLGSIVAMSVSVIIAKVGLGEAGPLDATFIRMVAGVVCVGLWILVTGRIGTGLKPVLDPTFAAELTVAVAVVTFGGFWLSLVAVKNIDVAVANTLNSTEPIFVLPLAAIYLREKVTVPQVLCAVVTVMGVALLSLPQ
jgi:drug/metabolite transporter (DMT)-like permease